MKSLVFDSGPVISFALNNILWLFPELKKKFKGEFLITPVIKEEIVTKPLKSKKFKFEAHQVAKLIEDKIFKIDKNAEIQRISDKLTEMANNCFFAHNNPIKIVHKGEMEAIACVIINNSESMVIDERTTRYLIEEPEKIHKLLERKLHTKVLKDKRQINEIKKQLKRINVIRSFELVSIAFEMGLLDKFILNMKNSKEELLDGLLWGIKLNGCAVSQDEIKIVKKKLT